jgi:hypothetical protein
MTQFQKRRMPLSQTVIGEFLVATVVTEFIEKSWPHFSRFGIAMNVS